MSLPLATPAVSAPAPSDLHSPVAPGPDAGARIEAACRRVAPLWPLDRFVAVNPFLGTADVPFAVTAARWESRAGARLVMPRSFYRDALASGRITRDDLAEALSSAEPRPAISLDAVLAALDAPDRTPRPAALLAAEVVDAAEGSRWAAVAVEEAGKVCAAWFDEGQASWAFPWRDQPLFAAWRAAMRYDRTVEILGLAGFRDAVAASPAEPRQAALQALAELGLAGDAVDAYCDRALAGIAGWAGAARRRLWDAELAGGADETLLGLLAIRLVFDAAVMRLRRSTTVAQAWSRTVRAMGTPVVVNRDLAIDLLLQDAYERAFQRGFLASLQRPLPTPAAAPEVQAVFCIDVRSEVLRRALETASPAVETRGFAGFFGVPIEVVKLGRKAGAAHAPVLLRPSAIVCESLSAEADQQAAVRSIRMADRLASGWAAFRSAAVASFGFVETMGLTYAPKLAAAAASLGGSSSAPNRGRSKAEPRLDPGVLAGRDTGMSLAQRVAAAEGFLRGVSLTHGFAPLVLLAGHGSTSANNPHAAGLDCGACGGQTGEANARVACLVLNEPAVRTALAERGIVIPADTWFVAGLHDTTTDTVRLHTDGVPTSHADRVARLQDALAAAGRLARAERAASLGLAVSHTLDADVERRSRDWSQVRPEWGLAGNAAFVAAPRARTRGLALGGRAFLHDYDWTRDDGFGTLTAILTAPVVVASWINLQYYGSTVDNAAFGAGSKMLHNVVGLVGVWEGAGGDLRPGLPIQSLSDGTGLRHEPVRLTVVIEAPLAAIQGVLAAQPGVRDLVANGWIHLFSLGEDGRATRVAA